MKRSVFFFDVWMFDCVLASRGTARPVWRVCQEFSPLRAVFTALSEMPSDSVSGRGSQRTDCRDVSAKPPFSSQRVQHERRDVDVTVVAWPRCRRCCTNDLKCQLLGLSSMTQRASQTRETIDHGGSQLDTRSLCSTERAVNTTHRNKNQSHDGVDANSFARPDR